MGGTLQAFYGFEYPTQLLALGLIQRSTSTFDALAGAQSARGPETFANTDYRFGLLSGNVGTATSRHGMGFWYHVASAPGVAISMASFNFTAGGGTAQHFNLCVRSDLKLEMYSAGTSTATQGSASGTVSATALTAATGYWVWCDVNYPTVGGTVTINVYVDHVLFYTFTFTGTGDATSQLAANIFGISGASAASVNHFIDNAISVQFIDGTGVESQRWRAAAKLSTVTGDGTDNDFTASAGSRFQCVDEASPNGDTDYVSIDSTSAQEQTFTMTDPGTPTAYDPWAVEERIQHKNGDAGKWAAAHSGRAYFRSTIRAGTSTTDPGASYFGVVMSPSGYYTSGLASGKLRKADIAAMEMGITLSADATEAAQWRVSAVQAEVLYLPEQIEPPLMGRKIIPFPVERVAPPAPTTFMGIFTVAAATSPLSAALFGKPWNMQMNVPPNQIPRPWRGVLVTSAVAPRRRFGQVA